MEFTRCPNCGMAVRLPYLGDQRLRYLVRDGQPPQHLILADGISGTSLLHMCVV